MHKYLRVLAVAILCSHAAKHANACDVCGCSGLTSTQNLGLLPQFSTHFVGLQYFHASSKSDFPSLFNKDVQEHSEQTYRNLQLWGRYQISKRLQAYAFLPYILNTNHKGNEQIQTNGIGDMSLLLNYAAPLPQPERQLLLLGIGCKLPTGTYNVDGTNDLASLSTGSGSLDLLTNINYTRKYRQWGYNAELGYVFTTANKTSYKFGNRAHLSGTLFSWWTLHNWTLLPQIGCKSEYSLKDYNNYTRKWLNTESGGLVCYTTIGLQTQLKSIGCRVQVQVPFYQNYAQGYINTQYKLETGLFMLF